jgi:hypothetical protein
MAHSRDPGGDETARSERLERLSALRHRLRPGARVRVIQQIAARHYAWGTAHVGTLLKYEQKQTGSWFAHSRGDKLWLDRLTLRKDDGEVFTFNLDEYTHLDVIQDAPAGEVAAGAVSTAEAPGA